MSEVDRRILRARLRLMLAHPFLANAVARLPLVELDSDSPWKTAATDGYHIFWSRPFFSKLSEPELVGVLAHEVLHVVLDHLGRREARNQEKWNVAIDHATNLFLLGQEFVLPEPHLADNQYRDRSAEEIYSLLEGPNSSGVGLASRSSTARVQRIQRIGSPGPATKRSTGRGADRFDDHLHRDDPGIPQKIRRNQPTPLEMDRLKHDLVREMRDELARRSPHSALAGDLSEAILCSRRGRRSWVHMLQQFTGGIRRDDYRFLPPSKRHLWRGLYLPSATVPGPRLIVCALDTSGSIGPAYAGRFLSEVHGLRVSAQCRLFVLQCDAAIQKVEMYDAWDSPSSAALAQTIGGGGTDFRPVFDWIANTLIPKEGRPDVLFYLTDGYGDFPRQAPPFPVVWLIPESCQGEVPFGSRIDVF